MEHKLYLRHPVVVEGKYDKIKVSQVITSPIFVLNGFSVFNDEQKRSLLKKAAKETGLILLTDSDRAGAFLRSRLKGILREGTVFQVYTSQIVGKERRKTAPSKDGYLGVEGVSEKELYELLSPFAEDGEVRHGGAGITQAMWYADGFSGSFGAEEKRKKLAKALDLPDNLSSKALLEAINLLYSYERYESEKAKL